jgi:hypothetical protein
MRLKMMPATTQISFSAGTARLPSWIWVHRREMDKARPLVKAEGAFIGRVGCPLV